MDPLRYVKPSKAEEVRMRKVCEEVLKRISSLGYEAMLGGSVAKGTWLKGEHDVDIFIFFDEEIDLKPLQKAFKAKVVRASRDYLHFTYKGYEFDVVPAKRVKPSEATNSIDISPYHVEYVKRKLRNPDDVRLLKAFMKAAHVYGAESHIQGFSGYTCELLIIKYGSFDKLISAVERWKPKVLIDIEGFYKDLNEAIKALGEAKTNAPLIVIDPVLKTRNVAAALSYENYARFQLRARLYLRKPSLAFFKLKEVWLKDLKAAAKKRGHKLIYAIRHYKDKFELAQFKRKLRGLKARIERNFVVYDYGLLTRRDKCLLYVELAIPKLPKIIKKEGPPVWVSSEHFDKFVNKWKKVFVEGTRLYAEEKVGDYENKIRRELLSL